MQISFAVAYVDQQTKRTKSNKKTAKVFCFKCAVTVISKYGLNLQPFAFQYESDAICDVCGFEPEESILEV